MHEIHEITNCWDKNIFFCSLYMHKFKKYKILKINGFTGSLLERSRKILLFLLEFAWLEFIFFLTRNHLKVYRVFVV